MGAYKKLNKQDAYITTHTAHKTWAVSSVDYATYGITTHSLAGNYLDSVQQLYYPSKSVDGNIISHSFDYYNQTSLFNSNARNLVTGSTIYSIPRDLYGVNIKPSTSFKLSLELYENGFLNVVDDGEGNLYVEGSSPRVYVGDIMYSHGIIVINPLTSIDDYVEVGYWDVDYVVEPYTPIEDYVDIGYWDVDYVTGPRPLLQTLTWQTSHPVFTHTYHCRIRESEFNHTQNPSALSNSVKTVYDNNGDIYLLAANQFNGDKNNNITGSEFQPYITTVGLYNDANQLIAVGKMAQPVPKSANTEMTITVKLDI
jgi:hypothetical protein